MASATTRFFTQRNLFKTKETNPNNSFSLVTYNTLAESIFLDSPGYHYCHENFKKRTDKEGHRHKLLLQELIWLDADILCLQEVDGDYYHTILTPALSNIGYTGFFIARSDRYNQGLASFYKHSKFELLQQKVVCNKFEMEALCKNVGKEDLIEYFDMPTFVHLMALRHMQSEKILAVGNVHATWDWYGKIVRQSLECCLATKILKEFVQSIERNSENQVGYILCGDFNIEPHFPVYKLLSSKALSDEIVSDFKKNDYVRYSGDLTMYSNPSEFKGKISKEELDILDNFQQFFRNYLGSSESTYKVVMGHEPLYTNFDAIEYNWTLDYIWHSSEKLQPTAVLDFVPIEKLKHLKGFPNEFFPSDHLALKAWYNFSNTNSSNNL